ncbi:MAG: cytochrome-c oxidase, cbb3-type subunit III [Betaproteobacteria bacterium]|nr:cytochrome-c oxidase, cbb3-type subunit III [Betaproteobacteria bacterium]MCC7215962.1 cytochrome-c oxidase, cbb3-type subunit III [Burkholderiales bacterium]
MSDFTSGFWNLYVIVLTVASIAGCAWLLISTGRIKVAAKTGAEKGPVDKTTGMGVTGHVWDDDLQEYNNPLPKWWSNLFWITIFFSVVYLILYPGLGNIPGVLGWTSSGAYAKERADFDARLAPLYDKYAKMDVEQIAADAAARQTGERMFLTYCSQCHGSDAGGGRGFPNLRDRDWLYGGAPATIIETVTGGRMGVMPAFGPVLGEDGLRNVTAYVRSLSGLPHDSLRAQLGKTVFTANCAACHQPDGKGNQAMGAPNLTDNVWLFGSSEKAISDGIAAGHNVGHEGGPTPMPSFKDTLSPTQIRLLAAYVWGLSNNPAAAK